MLHRHTHPETGAPGGWHPADMKHALASKHAGLIQTKAADGKIKGTVAAPVKGYVPAIRRPRKVDDAATILAEAVAIASNARAFAPVAA